MCTCMSVFGCLCLCLPSVNNYKHSVNFNKNQSRLGNSDDHAGFVCLGFVCFGFLYVFDVCVTVHHI